MKRTASLVGPPLVTLVVVIAVWDLAVRLFGIPAFLVPRPGAVVSAAWTERATLASALLTTSEGAVFEWVGAAGSPQFKEISRLVQERMKALGPA